MIYGIFVKKERIYHNFHVFRIQLPAREIREVDKSLRSITDRRPRIFVLYGTDRLAYTPCVYIILGIIYAAILFKFVNRSPYTTTSSPVHTKGSFLF